MAQFGAAHRIVLTKTDLLPDGALDARAVRAAALNPLAAVIADPDRRRAVQAAFAPGLRTPASASWRLAPTRASAGRTFRNGWTTWPGFAANACCGSRRWGASTNAPNPS
ncbi:hypothetical protein G6F62_014807 [Rhizopus arrhizus]|nr:hypothetical protein G6F62_014807 [Rhizopus arrhizus]